eukprot:CAMPEP_0174694590 /NCGR_PEP_ID=MMETSP1094-20130205/1149_1 /TAXON_ID=156173 /ORGANISM="Chrysochromulina brevifilum, Strain UTEX LB 985" /LENGTH=32 /DNA_ID= /DNA_START= /DNA_END= /DNA_ORIENTATION=
MASPPLRRASSLTTAYDIIGFDGHHMAIDRAL